MLKRTARISMACVTVAACHQPPSDAPSPEITFLNTPDMVDSGLPFSSAVRVDDMIYLSGVIGTDPSDPNTLVPGGIIPEARRSMEIIKSSLEAFGSSMDRVVKCTVFLADEADRTSFNEVYKTYFDRMPARSGVTVQGIDLGARVEIECIAVAS
ncbi:MAG TPA: Rid family hydrolase [Rhodothermales bacterium]